MSDTAARQSELLDQLVNGEVRAAQAFAARLRSLAELSDLADAAETSKGTEQFLGMEVSRSCRLSRMAAHHEIAEALR